MRARLVIITLFFIDNALKTIVWHFVFSDIDYCSDFGGFMPNVQHFVHCIHTFNYLKEASKELAMRPSTEVIHLNRKTQRSAVM